MLAPPPHHRSGHQRRPDLAAASGREKRVAPPARGPAVGAVELVVLSGDEERGAPPPRGAAVSSVELAALSGGEDRDAPSARGAQRAPRVLLAGAVLLLGGCGGDEPRFGLPDPASSQGDDILRLWRGSVVAALVVGSLVWGLIVWAGFRYRRRNDDLPSQLPENIPIEVLYTAIPLVVVAVLFGFTVATQQRVTALSDDPDVVVEVTGFQWSWQFRYPEEGVVVDSDGVDPPELVVPVGATVRFELGTADVNHSFWVPELLVKRDMIQGVDNAIDVDVTRAGTWTGRCAEFCGLEHHAMTFTFRAVEPDEYEAWLDDRAPADVDESGDDEETTG